jgi:hypothetical protein
LLKLGFAGGGGFLYAIRDNSGALLLGDGAGTATVGGRNVLTGRKTGNDIRLRVNTSDGTLKSYSGLGTVTLDGASIGARNITPNSNFMTGNIYSIIAVAGSVSDENRLNTETYINSKTKAY